MSKRTIYSLYSNTFDIYGYMAKIDESRGIRINFYMIHYYMPNAQFSDNRDSVNLNILAYFSIF